MVITGNNAHRLIERFVRLDLIGGVGGVLVVVAANTLVVKEPGVWVVMLPLAVLVGFLLVSLSLARRARSSLALVFLGLGNWQVAVAVSALFPFLWPIMVVTALMPLVVATPYLTGRRLVLFMSTTALMVGLVGFVGVLFDDDGVIEDIDDSLELVVVVGALMAQSVPIGVIIRQNNALQQLSNEALVQSRRRLIGAADAERSRIERDLHDGAQQRLVAATMRLRLLHDQLEDGDSVKAVDQIIEQLNATVEELREIAHGIYPPLLRARGLPDSLESAIRRFPSSVSLELEEIGRLDATVEAALYYAALEALTNAHKHAPGASLSVVLRRVGEQTTMIIGDDGPGFDLREVDHSNGLINISDRIASVGGSLEVVTAPGRGTTVTAVVQDTEGPG